MHFPSLISAFLLLVPVIGHAADGTLTLQLNDAIRAAVEKNLDVRAELFNSAQYEADINRYRALYDPLLKAQSSFTDSTTPSVNVNQSSSIAGKDFQFNAGIDQLLWSGGTASFNFNNAFNAPNNLPDYWQSGLGVSLTQPILRNFGRDATEISINVSRTSKFASLERFNARLLATVAQVRTEYYKLHSLREELGVKKVSLELARKILSDTQARVKAGVLPAMEVLNAEFGVVTREKELIDAERAVTDQVDVMRVLLQMENRTGEIQLADLPPRDLITTVESEATEKARNRPDIREQKRNLELNELQNRNLSQKIRPDLTFSATARLTGLDKTYQKNMEKVFTFDYPEWSVGVNFAYPLGNGAAENDFRKGRLKSEQISLQLRSLEENAAREVRSAIRGVVASHKQIEVADRGTSFAEERLRAFIRKSEVGLATTKDVLDVENDLAVSKSNQIKAVVGYANAVTAYWQVTGELLERQGIRVVEGDADKLYSEVR